MKTIFPPVRTPTQGIADGRRQPSPFSRPTASNALTVGSLNVIVDGVFQAGATLVTPLGNTLTITGYNAATGVISYTYTLGAAETHPSGAGENSLFEDFLVTLTDEDGDVDTDTLSVNIVDDVPTARMIRTPSVGGVATGNVITDGRPATSSTATPTPPTRSAPTMPH